MNYCSDGFTFTTKQRKNEDMSVDRWKVSPISQTYTYYNMLIIVSDMWKFYSWYSENLSKYIALPQKSSDFPPPLLNITIL